jgi:DNA polymerase-3 subunit alpha
MKNNPHLHLHTSASVYDGFGQPQDKVAAAKALGMSHLAITDHGTMSNCIEHHKQCRENNIIPIIGIEAYYCNDFLIDREKGKDFKTYRRHITLLAKNFTGYQNLCTMTTRANLEQRYYKPLIDYPLLKEYSNGLVVLSGCVLGEIPYHIINNDMDAAKLWSENFLQIFGENFFFEAMPNSFDDQKRANEGLIKLSQEFGRPLVMTNDAHYTKLEDLDTYILYRTMGKNLKDELNEKEEQQEKIREQYKELYLCSSDTMNERWFDLMGTDGTQYLENAQKVADTVESYDIKFNEEVPRYDKNEENAHIILRQRAEQALKKMGLWTLPYIERMKEELRIICKKSGGADYYLLVADMCDFSRKNDVALGPGRGSGVASLIAYALGITQVDPLFFNLPFYRFMDDERKTPFDFDIDHSTKNYHKTVSYLQNKYPGMVAQIANILFYEGDNLINDIGKALSMEKEEIVYIKSMLKKLNLKIPEKEKICAIKEIAALEEKYGVITHYCKMFGNIKTFSQHASGVAITPYQINEYVPLFVRGSETDLKINTAFDKDALAAIGIMKIDILRVGYLDVLSQCFSQLSYNEREKRIRISANIASEEQQYYRPFNQQDIPLDDAETFKSFCDLNLEGTFQLGKYGGYKIVGAVQPQNIFELMDIISLDRPGSLDMNQLKVYVDGKNGKKQHTLLSKYCDRSFGALLYQEQIMQVCHELGDMSWGTAYKVMKKVTEELPPGHPLTIEFVQGAIKNGLQKEEAEKLFKSLTSYTFNQGHAAAYAVLTYWGMWLKIHFPHLFFLELLKENIGNKNYKQMEGDAIYNKLPVFLAHVNGEANYHLFSYHGRKCIRQGLLIIDHVGPNAARIIQEEKEAYGPFVSEENFLLRMDIPGKKKIITSRVVEALQQYGALNFLTDDYVERTQKYNSSLLSTAKYQKARAKKNVKE